MPSHHPDAPPTYYRLTEETWAEIVEEYKNGATARDLGAKWKVAPSSIYRHACKDGWTKKACGDARARAHARLVEEEERAASALTPVGTRALKSLFQPAPASDPEAENPGALMRQATLAAGRAMRGRLWSEAQALAKLAESFSRLEKERRVAEETGTLTYEKVPLALVMDILEGGVWNVPHSTFIWPDKDDPELDAKQRYHRMRSREYKLNCVMARFRKMTEDYYARTGETPPPERDLDIDAMSAEALVAEADRYGEYAANYPDGPTPDITVS